MKACLMFAAGILLSYFTNPPVSITLFLAGTGILILILSLRYDFAGSLWALAVLFLSGLCVHSIHRELHKPLSVPQSLLHASVVIEGRVKGIPRHTYGNTYFMLSSRTVTTGGSIRYSHGELPCVIFEKTRLLNEGSLIKVRGKIRKIKHIPTLRNMTDVSRRNYNHRLIVDTILTEHGSKRIYESFFPNIRNKLSDLIECYPYGGRSGILRAMIFGDRSGLSRETYKQFAQTGIAHILAVSGMHVGIVVMLLSFFLNVLTLKKKTVYAIIVLCMILYAGVCGFRPPVMRAVILLSLVIGATLLERPKNHENSLFAALIIILAVDPQSLLGPSLQLSFAAVWSITTFHKPLMDMLGGRFRDSWLTTNVLSLVLISFLATLGTAPVVAAHFEELPVYGIPANLLAVPLTFCIVSFGAASITATALGPLMAPLAGVLSFFTGGLITVLDTFSYFISGLPCSTLKTGSISLFAGCSFTVWLYCLSRSSGRQLPKKGLVYIPLIFLLTMVWSPVVESFREGEANGAVLFFDAGQGDAALVAVENTRYFLVDTGPAYEKTSTVETLIIPGLRNAGITHLDGIFISHNHSDHMGGLATLVREVDVERIFCSTVLEDSLKTLYGERVTGLSAGDSIAVNNTGILVLSPGDLSRLPEKEEHDFQNNASLVLRWDVSGTRILFTGDIDDSIQRHTVFWEQRIRSDIIKIPHHGARGLDIDFIRAVEPSISIISCGIGNRYGHPSASTLTKLNNEYSKIFRTDIHGTIMIQLPDMTVSTL